ncbi:hypothetical protein [Flavobacterium foetidum]|uniref:hypothetical protein n=1 Tax=Flavobacterium foetidum TaxID=2026681 RepID=UPI00107509D2|nr:hypothetical protein [Flavobacterium foetidum]KAF2517778.1 hypothetical protein E0W73_00810 [Flavobacterium foetidum]
MKKLSILLFAVVTTFTSCSNDDDTTQEEDTAKLSKMHAELVVLSGQETQTCTNPDEWTYTTLSNSCGGQFFLYSKKINKEQFLKKVQQYNESSRAYTIKWSIFCAEFSVSPAIPPTIECVDGKPKFVYNHNLH